MLWRVTSKPARKPPAVFIQPCISIQADKVPDRDGWIYEIKHDGYRMQVRKNGNRVRLFTRRGFDWTERYPWAVESVAKLKPEQLTIDAELVVAGADGMDDFAALHSRCSDRHAFLYAFDLMQIEDEDLRPRPLLERKDSLAKVLRRAQPGIRLVEHDAAGGPALFNAACAMGLEGIVAKRADSPYRCGPKPCKSWVKIKNKRAPGWMRVHDGTDG